MTVISRQGVGLHYTAVGTGPVIFFHTGGGGDGSMWQTAGYLELLPGYRHVMFDHRGRGRSDRPTSLEQHRLTEYVNDVRAVLEAEQIAPVIFIGYSAGGVIGCALAARFPELVSALVVIGGVAHPDEDSAWRREAAGDVRATGVTATISQMSDAEAESPPAWFVDNLTTTEDEMFALTLEAWADEPTEATFFSEMRCPTLIVCGDAENEDGSAELAEAALADGEVACIPRFGHLQVFWASDTTAPVIARFLERVRPTPIG